MKRVSEKMVHDEADSHVHNGNTRRRGKEKRDIKEFSKDMAENVTNLVKNTNLHIQEIKKKPLKSD